jgi:hypothetical protein
MCWKGYSLYACSAEFRLFWVQSKLAESGATQPHPIAPNRSKQQQNGRQQQGQQQQQQQGQQQPGQQQSPQLQQLGQQHLGLQPPLSQQQQQPQQQETRRFLPLPAYRATPGGLRAAYSDPVK